MTAEELVRPQPLPPVDDQLVADAVAVADAGADAGADTNAEAGVRAAVPLRFPPEGVPAVVTDADALADAVQRLARGSGPVAVDAERASGYRYSARAYLVQLRRDPVGTVLIDPIACPNLAPVTRALSEAEWVLHAASQDLPCLADVGMRPTRVFDTELAGRLAGFQRVALATLVEELLGYRLDKHHSAADWSRRPLPEAWLRYAALDVQLLIELRNALEAVLREQHKLAWAHEEFDALLRRQASQPRAEPWRRTSGIHHVRRPAGLAVIRELWQTRDRLARERDLAPRRLIRDSALVAAAQVFQHADATALLAQLPEFAGLRRGDLAEFEQALLRVRELAGAELPRPTPTAADGPPPANRWADRDQAAAARLARCRAAMSGLATTLGLPSENLLQPDLVRRLAWNPPAESSAERTAAELSAAGARPWQVELTAHPLAEALAEPDTPAAAG